MNRRPYFTAGILLLVLLLCSCGNPAGSAAAQSDAVSLQSTVVSHEVDFSPLGATYDRNYIISQNLQSDATAENPGAEWAKMYIAQKYQKSAPTDVTVELLSRQDVVKGLFVDQAIALIAYRVHFYTETNLPELDREKDRRYGEDVQVIALISEDEKTLTLSALKGRGFVDFDILSNYMVPDTRCTVKTEVAPVCGESVKSYNLTRLLPGYYSSAYEVKTDVIAYIRSNEEDSFGMVIHNIKTGKDLFSKQYGKIFYIYLTFEDSTLVVKFRERSDTGERIDTFSMDGTLLTSMLETYSGDQKLVLPGSRVTVIRDKSSIYLLDENGEKTLLLKGNPSEEEDCTSFSICFALDDHRFVFAQYGWEWLNYAGVYDLNTKQETKIQTFGEEEMHPIAAGNGKIYLVNYTYDGENPLYLWSVDQAQPDSTLEKIISIDNIVDFSPSMRYAVSISGEDPGRFFVYDLISCSIKSEFTAYYVNDWERISFRDENTVVAFSQGIVGFDDYMLTYTFS